LLLENYYKIGIFIYFTELGDEGDT